MISSIFSEEGAYALMAEVGATPKPGLVDRHDSGAHTDMNYDTFAASTTAIVPYRPGCLRPVRPGNPRISMPSLRASAQSELRRKKLCLLLQME